MNQDSESFLYYPYNSLSDIFSFMINHQNSEQSTCESYKGGAFHPSLNNGRSQGDLILTPFEVSFYSEGRHIFSLKAGSYTIERGGAGNRLFFFKSSDNQFTIYTADKTLLKSMHLNTNPEFIRLHQQIKKNRLKSITLFFIIIIIFISIPLLVFKGSSPAVNKLAMLIPKNFEKKIGDTVFAQHTLSYPLISSEMLKKQIDIVTEKLFSDYKGTIPLITIHETNEANALAMPGGRIILYKGVFKHIKNGSELSAVIAHEAGHIQKRHGLRSLIRTAGYFILIKSLFGDISGLFAVLLDNSSFLIRMSYSRLMEAEADHFALQLLADKGISPLSLAGFLENLKGDKKEFKMLKYLSTHPLTSERINNIRHHSESMKVSSEKNLSEIEEALQKIKNILFNNNKLKEEREHENHS